MRRLDVFGDALERIRSDYVDPVDDAEILTHALGGIAARIPALAQDQRFKDAKRRIAELAGEKDLYAKLDVVGGVFDIAFKLDPPLHGQDDVVDAAITAMQGHYSTKDPPSPRRGVGAAAVSGPAGLGLVLGRPAGKSQIVSTIALSPAEAAGLRAGDVIESLDGKPVGSLALDDLVNRLRGPVGSLVTLEITRNNKPKTISVTRQIIYNVDVVARSEGKVAYVRIATFVRGTQKRVRDAIAAQHLRQPGKLGGIVLDLRQNSGGPLDEMIELADDFLDSGVIVSLQERVDNPIVRARPGEVAANVPIVIITDKTTAGGTEAFAAALKDNNRARLVGMPTAGAGAVETVIPLPDGAPLTITTGRLYRPSGQPLLGKGLSVDVEVRQTSDDDGDAALKAAITMCSHTD